MQLGLGKYLFSFSKTTWWVRGPSGCWILKMPWCPALFSERYGHWKHRRFAGFRIGWRESDDDVHHVNQLARKFCAQENEIWEETTSANRRRWVNEARAALAEQEKDDE